jgi:hypothetical protein
MSMKHKPRAGMCTPRTTIVASLVAALALVATASLAGGAAPAQAYYFKNPDHSLLRFPPKFPSFRPCFTDTVTLRPGGYLHGAYMVSKSHRTRPDLEQVSLDVRVRTAYHWEICRGWNPNPNPEAFSTARYQVRSTLVPVNGRGPKNSALMTFENDQGRKLVYGDGQYEWGGRIVLDCPDCTSPQHELATTPGVKAALELPERPDLSTR